MKTIAQFLLAFRNVRGLCGRDSSRLSDADLQQLSKALKAVGAA